MATQQASGTDYLRESTVVDVDVHTGGAIPYERVGEFVDEPHRGRLLQHSHGRPLPFSGWDRNSGGKIDAGSPAFEDAADLDRKLCQEFGIDHPVLNTTSWIARLPETDFAVALARAYNEVLLADFLSEFDHYRGLVTIAPQDPGAAAEEIHRVGPEDGIVGIYLATGGPDPPLGDPVYDELYAAAADHDLAVVYHGHADAFISDFARQNQALESYAAVSALAHPWDQMLTMTSLFEHGTPAKFPDLDFVFLEAGMLWAAYTVFRLNKQPNASPLLSKQPEAYFRDQMYVGTQPIEEPVDPAMLGPVFSLLGPESILFASDFPHWDFDSPAAIADAIGAAVDAEDRDRIFAGNAREVFGLDG